jgi:hypothetical protein
MQPLRLGLKSVEPFCCLALVAVSLFATNARAAGGDLNDAATREFSDDVKPLVANYCLKCHSSEKHKGDIDLEQFSSATNLFKHPKTWEKVLEQLNSGDMPPSEKPQPAPEERQRLLAGVNALLDAAAAERAGDPGPVVLRRLNNAEYTFTIRDLTRVESLDPVKEFPADSASGEGFLNVGQSLVMSPALVSKYLDAAKDISRHAVLLPDGIEFSPGTSPRDWTDEKLSAIRNFYARFSERGEGMAVNLQGIKFNTKDAGVLPIEKYLNATLTERDAIVHHNKTLAEVASQYTLNTKYLGILWNALNDSTSSLLLDVVRAKWRAARPGNMAPLLDTIRQWQQALWLFTSVGHIGKRDGPTAWQVPVAPLAANREIRFKVPPTTNNEVTLYLVTSDAGDGNAHDFAEWDNPRFVAPGRPDLPLRDIANLVGLLDGYHRTISDSAADCLAAAAEATGLLDQSKLEELAHRYHVDPLVLAAWLDYLGLGKESPVTTSHLTNKLEIVESHDFVKGWVGSDSLSVLANSSDKDVRIPGNLRAHSIAVHPSPKLRVVVGWRSPVTTTLHIHATVQHAHTECGNGVDWLLELRRSSSRLRLASGLAQDATEFQVGPFDNFAVQPGDLLCLSVGPHEGNHSCDLTALNLKLSDANRQWDLANDISPDILAANPHPDRLGNRDVWHFFSEPDAESTALPVIPAGSLLAKWWSAADLSEKCRLGKEIQELLSTGVAPASQEAPPNMALYRQIASLNGPLMASLRRQNHFVRELASSHSKTHTWGLDSSMFGPIPVMQKVSAESLGVRAPSVIPVRLPSQLVEGCEFVATATLQSELGDEGSVQMQVLTQEPANLGLLAGSTHERGAKSTWSDGQLPVLSDAPILVRDGSAARKRMEEAFTDFRQLFPAALCYTKIVPVDEVVTLTLFYREDDHLRRLMLDEAQTAELDRLWSQLHYVSQDALKEVDAFDQLWQFATQDADPSAFEPLREPIKKRAAEFRKLLDQSEPAHLDGVLKFSESAYRRPLTVAEKDQLRALYRNLRSDEIPHEQAIRLTLARVLTAPAFLYRTESSPAGNQPAPITDWELATRLSYFLWSSAPDAQLRSLAMACHLTEPEVIREQVHRMLRDPRVCRLASEFAAAWLQIHDFESLDEKSERYFPTFANLRESLYEESLHFFTDLFQNDGSILSILDCDYTFLNGPLAAHYGIPGVNGPEWRRVKGVKKYGRGGVLGMGAILAKQSGASRTSPILRGNWVAEVLLGDRLPRPPKDVPRLPEDEGTEKLTIRQLVEKHSSDPRCAGCHVHIDGYGFCLEEYDAIGRLRTQDLGGRTIDTRAKVFDGTMVDGAEGLRGYLLTQKRATVMAHFGRKLLGYALGRSVLLSDRPLLAQIQHQLESNDFRFSAAVETIVNSRQFREIRSRDMIVED